MTAKPRRPSGGARRAAAERTARQAERARDDNYSDKWRARYAALGPMPEDTTQLSAWLWRAVGVLAEEALNDFALEPACFGRT